jgi:hypothetical protein
MILIDRDNLTNFMRLPLMSLKLILKTNFLWFSLCEYDRLGKISIKVKCKKWDFLHDIDSVTQVDQNVIIIYISNKLLSIVLHYPCLSPFYHFVFIKLDWILGGEFISAPVTSYNYVKSVMRHCFLFWRSKTRKVVSYAYCCLATLYFFCFIYKEMYS